MRTLKKKSGLDPILSKVSLEDLTAFIKMYAKKNKDFRTDFEIYFVDKDDSIDLGNKYEELIGKLISKFSDRGFIHYRDSRGLAIEVASLLKNAENSIAIKNYGEAFYITSAILPAMMKALTQADDSSGHLSEVILDDINLMIVISESIDVPMDVKVMLFDFVHKEIKDQIYFDYGDFGYDLLDLYRILALTIGNPNKFVDYLDLKIVQLKNSSYGSYQREHFISVKISFLKEIGKIEEADQVAFSNMELVEVRKSVLETAFEKNDLALAKNLIDEGIKIAQKNNLPGTVNEWEKQIIRIGRLEGDVETVRKYTKYFAFDNGFNKEYYHQWKATFSQEDWNEVIETFIVNITNNAIAKHQTKKGQSWFLAQPPLLMLLAPIHIEEKNWDRLLALVQSENRLNSTLKYHSYLHKLYPIELLDLYITAFENEGKSVSSRSEYRDLSKKMKAIMKDIPSGKDKIQAIARKLIAQYPRRPAMIDELNKVLN